MFGLIEESYDVRFATSWRSIVYPFFLPQLTPLPLTLAQGSSLSVSIIHTHILATSLALSLRFSCLLTSVLTHSLLASSCFSSASNYLLPSLSYTPVPSLSSRSLYTHPHSRLLHHTISSFYPLTHQLL